MRIAAGVEEPDRGRVRVGGRLLSGMRRSGRKLDDRIAYVDQRMCQRSSGPILDWVALPLLRNLPYPDARQRAMAALARVRAEDAGLARWPELSADERTRVGLAQALVREPALLIIDDLTMGMSRTDAASMIRLLYEAMSTSRMGVLISASDLPGGLRVDRLMSLSRGRLV
jgi:ABC-type Mn2+/Zn2+ transport system ATPase subunit